MPTGTIAIADGSDLSFQGEVTFDTTVDGLKGQEYAMVYVEAFQDGVKVWGQLRRPDHIFTLGGDSSAWVANGGGPADCKAWLRTFKSKVPGGSLNLDSVEFHAEG